MVSEHIKDKAVKAKGLLKEGQMELKAPEQVPALVCMAEQSGGRNEGEGEAGIAPSFQMVPSALRNYALYLKVDKKRLLSDEDFNRVCVVVAGDQRRIFQRVLLGMYQRAFEKRDVEEVKRARLLLSLHERGVLFQSLEVVR